MSGAHRRVVVVCRSDNPNCEERIPAIKAAAMMLAPPPPASLSSPVSGIVEGSDWATTGDAASAKGCGKKTNLFHYFSPVTYFVRDQLGVSHNRCSPKFPHSQRQGYIVRGREFRAQARDGAIHSSD